MANNHDHGPNCQCREIPEVTPEDVEDAKTNDGITNVDWHAMLSVEGDLPLAIINCLGFSAEMQLSAIDAAERSEVFKKIGQTKLSLQQRYNSLRYKTWINILEKKFKFLMALMNTERRSINVSTIEEAAEPLKSEAAQSQKPTNKKTSKSKKSKS